MKTFSRLLGIISGLLLTFTCQADQAFETQAIFNASQILPPDVVAGPHYKVDETVTNDGYMNNYTIHSEYGDVQVSSTAKLRKYIREIAAVAEMKKISGSEEFTKGMTDKAGAVVEGAANLVTDPVGTVSSTVSGVGKLFSRAGENLTGGSRSEAEGSRMSSLLGYEKAKRDIGYKFGVDVYSHNKILQDELNSLSSAGGTGTLVMSGLLMAVPGGAGIAVSVTGGTEMMDDVMRDSAPADLRKMNREKLAAMGVSADIIDLYIANGIYTPREQTAIVLALNNMPNTKNRADYIKYATLAGDPDTAFFRQRQAQMYEAYGRIVEPIDSLVTIGGLTTARTMGGKIVFNLPLDYMLWTKDLAALADTINSQVAGMEGIKGKEILVTGAMSPLAKDSIEKRGWIVHEMTEKPLSLPTF